MDAQEKEQRRGHGSPETRIKICGVTTKEAADTAIAAGCDFLGCVFYPKSPRNITPQEAAELMAHCPARVRTVAVCVDPDGATLEQIMHRFAPDMLQLHGQESPAYVSEVHRRYGVEVIKAISVSTRAEVRAALAYAAVAQWMLFDAKPAPGSALPGGNGEAFDWSVLEELQPMSLDVPWMLSGGLNAQNVQQAVRATQAPAVDVSSGVESAPGIKDIDKIREFCNNVRHV